MLQQQCLLDKSVVGAFRNCRPPDEPRVESHISRFIYTGMPYLVGKVMFWPRLWIHLEHRDRAGPQQNIYSILLLRCRCVRDQHAAICANQDSEGRIVSRRGGGRGPGEHAQNKTKQGKAPLLSLSSVLSWVT